MVSELLSCMGVLGSFIVVQVLAFCDRYSGFGEVLKGYGLSGRRCFLAYTLTSLILSFLWIIVGFIAVML
ncbi:MAG: hypothetical protein ACUVRS_00030 [Armatimonadota bacterium]